MTHRDTATEAFIDRHVRSGRGDAVAIRTPESAWTYAELQARVRRAGTVLRAAGVERGQRVALLLPDGLDFAAAFFGALAIGAVAVPLNTRLGASDCRTILRDSGARLLVVDADLLPMVAEIRGELPNLKAVLVAGEPSCGHPRLGELLRDASPVLEPEPTDPDEMACWLYTSGTTGSPKAAVHLHRTLRAGHHDGADVLGLTDRDRVFVTSKLFFAYALGNGLLNPLLAGAQTFLHPAWADPTTAVEVLRAFRPTLFFSVPTFYARLLRAAPPPDAFGSVRLCISAGERLPAELCAAWHDRFGVPILDGIGATETLYMFLSNRPDRLKAGSAGVEVPGTEARVLDPAGREVPAGTEGVLWIKTPSAAAGYWERPDLTRQSFVGEWYRTRDVFCRDAEGFYHHRGREDDFFKVAGMWVPPAAVEAAFLAHPGVQEVGVVGAEDGTGLVKPFAFVVPKAPAARLEPLVRELDAFVGQRLPAHQRPRGIFLMPELPRTATGKLQRYKLSDQVRARLAGARTGGELDGEPPRAPTGTVPQIAPPGAGA